MQRPENYSLLILLILASGILMLAVGWVCHALARRVILRSRYRALKICLPPSLMFLVVVLYIVVPAVLIGYYQTSHGYQLQPDEAPGPFALEAADLALLSLFLFGFILLFCYAVYLMFMLTFFRELMVGLLFLFGVALLFFVARYT
jgi:hypothetical protein